MTYLLLLLSTGCSSKASTLAASLATPRAAAATPTRQPLIETPATLATPTATNTATATAAAATAPDPLAITFSADGQHAFPLAGDLSLLTWTHYHWDGANTVDVEAARHLAGDSEAFINFTQRPVVATASGVISIADNPAGGLALLLEGDDGLMYYYGHLNEQWVTEGQRVQAGDLLGRIGNTGRWTQYIEPHLHLSMFTRSAEDWRWAPDVNGAEKLLAWFGRPWQDLNIPDYPLDYVSGWPLNAPAQITRSFAENQAANPDLGAIDLLPVNAGSDPVPVYATLGGEINVNRATVMGLRVQITNRPSRSTVVYSFMLDTSLSDGDVVQHGDLVGHIAPAASLNYMFFINDVQTDPAPTLVGLNY